MFLSKFEKDQVVADIDGIKMGGQPGENPTVLLGTIFYTGHKIVGKRKKCEFDRKRAEELINRQETLSDETGVPGMLDIVALYPDEIRVYIDFVTSVTDMPFSIDIWKLEPKLAAAHYIAEQGLADRAIYSSIAPWSEDIEREIRELRDLGIRSAIIVCFNAEDKTTAGKVKALEDLLPKAEEAGIVNTLVDTSVLSVPAASFSFQANRVIKERLGLPVGCAPANGTDMWKTPKERWGKMGFAGVDSAAHALAVPFWNDFLLYGPIESAPWMFPAVATADVITSSMVYERTGELPEGEHPLRLLFPEFIEEIEKGEDQEDG
ncbi:MAG: tetrahydromethanopterin S-methyltransferase subunit H [Candidatus Hydrothermarchaeaceae archaeon]